MLLLCTCRLDHAVPSTSYMGRASAFAGSAARYLPIYVHFGSQHHLHALPGEAPPLAPTPVQDSAEDAETLATLRQQGAETSGAPGGAISDGAPEPAQRGGYLGALAVQQYRSYVNVLTYHRMYAMRQRAAAHCAAALGPAWHSARPRAPAELCDGVAPPLDARAASARLPPARVHLPAPDQSAGQQPSRCALTNKACDSLLALSINGDVLLC